MTDARCACGKPCNDATFCVSCGYTLDDALAQITAHHGLGWDLNIAMTRQDRIIRPAPRADEDGDQDRDEARQMPGTLKPTPIPYTPRAATAAAQLHKVLRIWANHITHETYPQRIGPLCRRRPCGHESCLGIRSRQRPPTSITALAAWLRPRVGWLRYHPAGQRAHDDITAAVRAAVRAIDRPAERAYAGPCDECGEDLYARLGARYVECANCGQVYDVDQRRRWLLRSAEDVLATAPEIARAITRLGQPVTPSAIRGYVHRRQLISHGQRTVGGRAVPLYRLGDVLDILARQAAHEGST